MLDQHIAGQPQQVVGMVDDVGHDDARLAPPLVDPVLAHLIALAALAKGQGEAHRRAPARLLGDAHIFRFGFPGALDGFHVA